MAIRPDQFDANGYLLLTAKEWREKHRDFKGTRADGTKVCNWLDPKGGGTCSVPVRIVKELPPLTNPRRAASRARVVRFYRYGSHKDNVTADRPTKYMPLARAMAEAKAYTSGPNRYALVMTRGGRVVKKFKSAEQAGNNPRRNPMAKRRRSTRHRRDSRGRFLPRGRHRATRRSRRTRRSSRSLSVAGSGRSASPRRILTLLGIGAAAIMLTQKLTSPAAAAQRAAALAAQQSSGTAARRA